VKRKRRNTKQKRRPRQEEGTQGNQDPKEQTSEEATKGLLKSPLKTASDKTIKRIIRQMEKTATELRTARHVLVVAGVTAAGKSTLIEMSEKLFPGTKAKSENLGDFQEELREQLEAQHKLRDIEKIEPKTETSSKRTTEAYKEVQEACMRMQRKVLKTAHKPEGREEIWERSPACALAFILWLTVKGHLTETQAHTLSTEIKQKGYKGERTVVINPTAATALRQAQRRGQQKADRKREAETTIEGIEGLKQAQTIVYKAIEAQDAKQAEWTQLPDARALTREEYQDQCHKTFAPRQRAFLEEERENIKSEIRTNNKARSRRERKHNRRTIEYWDSSMKEEKETPHPRRKNNEEEANQLKQERRHGHGQKGNTSTDDTALQRRRPQNTRPNTQRRRERQGGTVNGRQNESQHHTKTEHTHPENRGQTQTPRIPSQSTPHESPTLHENPKGMVPETTQPQTGRHNARDTTERREMEDGTNTGSNGEGPQRKTRTNPLPHIHLHRKTRTGPESYLPTHRAPEREPPTEQKTKDRSPGSRQPKAHHNMETHTNGNEGKNQNPAENKKREGRGDNGPTRMQSLQNGTQRNKARKESDSPMPTMRRRNRRRPLRVGMEATPLLGPIQRRK
jgi:hypothetical protein